MIMDAEQDLVAKIFAGFFLPVFKCPEIIRFDHDATALIPGSILPARVSLPAPSYAVSSGPYSLAAASDRELRLVRNPYYGGESFTPDTLAIKIIPEYDQQILAYRDRQIDLLEVEYGEVEQFRLTDSLLVAPTACLAFLSANSLKDYLQDGIFMTALSCLINRQALTRVVLNEKAESIANPFAEWFSLPELERLQFDRSRGRSLLKSNKSLPRYLSLYLSPDHYALRRTGEYLRDILEREKIFLTIYPPAGVPDTSGQMQFQQFDLMLSQINLSPAFPAATLHQTNFHYGLGRLSWNCSLHPSPSFDSLMTDFLSGQKDSAIFGEYVRGLLENPQGIFLFSPRRVIMHSGKYKGVAVTPEGLLDLHRIEAVLETQR